MSVTRLWYLLIDHKINAVGHPSRVDMPPDANVMILVEKIKEENAPKLARIDANDLVVWKLCHPPTVKSVSRTKDLERFLSTISQHHLCERESDSMVEEETPARQLYYADTISELGDLPEGKLHVFVQLPGLPHGEKRPRSSSSVLEKARRKRMVLGDIAEFHSKIWNKGPQAHATVFVTMPVERPQLTGVEVPSQCCIMKSPPYCSASTYLSGVFIRHEFVLAVENIVAFYKGENFNSKGIGGEAQTQFPVTVVNPFLDRDFPLNREKKGVIVTGAPGIGKSVLLEFILHLRNLAGRPTIFVLDDRCADLFTSDGISRFEGVTIDESKLPPSVWALLDSNRDLIGVPEWVTRLGCFIVQAATPRRDRLKWEEKEVGIPRYVMKMWSLEEVLAARMLQEGKFQASETQLQTFFEHYPPSARTAYNFVSRARQFDVEIRNDINKLSLDDVVKMVYSMTSLRIDTEVPHQFFIMQPGETRSSVSLEFASQHILNMLVSSLSQKAANAARILFEEYNRNSVTKVFAGPLLEGILRDDFTQGGAWRIHQMELSARTSQVNHWKIPPKNHYTDQYLIVGGHNNPIVRISDKRPDERTGFNTFPCFTFDAAIEQVTETGYYIRTAKNEAMLDAFYYDAKRKEATILQVTVSTSHSVNTKGLDWLKGVGVKSARYVAVTGPQAEFDLPVPIAYDGEFLKEKYHLVLAGPAM